MDDDDGRVEGCICEDCVWDNMQQRWYLINPNCPCVLCHDPRQLLEALQYARNYTG